MKAKTIAMWMEKGGTGKTTASFNLAACLATKGYKTLLIDLDPSGGASRYGGLQPGTLMESLGKYVMSTSIFGDKTCDPNEAIQRLESVNMDLLPSNHTLESVEPSVLAWAGDDPARVSSIMKVILEPLRSNYDFIVFDGAAKHTIFNRSALSVSDMVIIPMKAYQLDLGGIEESLITIQKIKERMNPDLVIGGLFFTQYEKGVRHCELVRQIAEGELIIENIPLFKTIISKSIECADAGLYGQSLQQYRPKGIVAGQYRSVTDEVLRKFENMEVMK